MQSFIFEVCSESEAKLLQPIDSGLGYSILSMIGKLPEFVQAEILRSSLPGNWEICGHTNSESHYFLGKVEQGSVTKGIDLRDMQLKTLPNLFPGAVSTDFFVNSSAEQGRQMASNFLGGMDSFNGAVSSVKQILSGEEIL